MRIALWVSAVLFAPPASAGFNLIPGGYNGALMKSTSECEAWITRGESLVDLQRELKPVLGDYHDLVLDAAAGLPTRSEAVRIAGQNEEMPFRVVRQLKSPTARPRPAFRIEARYTGPLHMDLVTLTARQSRALIPTLSGETYENHAAAERYFDEMVSAALVDGDVRPFVNHAQTTVRLSLNIPHTEDLKAFLAEPFRRVQLTSAAQADLLERMGAFEAVAQMRNLLQRSDISLVDEVHGCSNVARAIRCHVLFQLQLPAELNHLSKHAMFFEKLFRNVATLHPRALGFPVPEDYVPPKPGEVAELPAATKTLFQRFRLNPAPTQLPLIQASPAAVKNEFERRRFAGIFEPKGRVFELDSAFGPLTVVGFEPEYFGGEANKKAFTRVSSGGSLGE